MISTQILMQRLVAEVTQKVLTLPEKVQQDTHLSLTKGCNNLQSKCSDDNWITHSECAPQPPCFVFSTLSICQPLSHSPIHCHHHPFRALSSTTHRHPRSKTTPREVVCKNTPRPGAEVCALLCNFEAILPIVSQLLPHFQLAVWEHKIILGSFLSQLPARQNIVDTTQADHFVVAKQVAAQRSSATLKRKPSPPRGLRIISVPDTMTVATKLSEADDRSKGLIMSLKNVDPLRLDEPYNSQQLHPPKSSCQTHKSSQHVSQRTSPTCSLDRHSCLAWSRNFLSCDTN